MTATELRETLTRAQLTQRGAARVLNINDRTMRRYCAGDQAIPPTIEYSVLYLAFVANAAERAAIYGG
jgi:hypothetical protein